MHFNFTAWYLFSKTDFSITQVVVVPYNTLLHKSTRKASGLKLSGSVIIIDEAHNLLEAIGHIHSSVVSGQQVIIPPKICFYTSLSVGIPS